MLTSNQMIHNFFAEVFNLAKFHIPPVNLPENVRHQVAQMIGSTDVDSICLDKRLYSKYGELINTLTFNHMNVDLACL
jgi:hypothetical protein